MYSIDLLQGTGRPPRPRWWQVVVLTLAFVTLGGIGAYGYTMVQDIDQQIVVQTRLQADYQHHIGRLGEVDAFLREFARERKQLRGKTRELNTILEEQHQWSPILATVAGLVPRHVSLSDILVKRREKKISSKESTFDYILVIGVITQSDHAAIEGFVNALRKTKKDYPRLQEVRVANQQFREVQERNLLYYVIECRFE